MASSVGLAVGAEAQDLPTYPAGARTYPAEVRTYQAAARTYPGAVETYDVRFPTVNLVAPVDDPPEAAPPPAEQRRVRYRLSGDILFDFDKDDIREEAETILARLAEQITADFQTATVLVEGHTDSKGTDAYNQDLSERRAASVQRWFVENGAITAAAISTAGFGELRPVADNQNPDGSDNPAGRQLNRRVEVVVEGF